MTNTGNDNVNKPFVGSDTVDETCVYEDEIHLMEYFLFLWNHKKFILLCSVLPALIVGVLTHLSPNNYTVTYTYDVRDDARGEAKRYVEVDEMGDVTVNLNENSESDLSNWNLNEKNFQVLKSRFYSLDNLNKIAGKLKIEGLDEYANKLMSGAGGDSGFVIFEVSPSFVDLSKLRSPDPDQLDKLRDMKAFLLNMTITGKPIEDLPKIVFAIRRNFEEVIPLYMIQEQLSADIRDYNYKLASIENAKFDFGLDLKNNADMLARLKKIDFASVNEQSNVVLQFDVSNESRYLPLSCQIQALESKIVEIEGKIATDMAHYDYYKDLSSLSDKMIAELNDKLLSGQFYTVEQFITFLADLINKTEKAELKDYLASSIKKIENRISVTSPVSLTPKVYLINKGTVKKSAIVFLSMVMISIFVSCLIESHKLKKARLS